MSERNTLLPTLEEKKALVSKFGEKMKECKTVLVASSRGLPGSQFHAIKKGLREKAELGIARKSVMVKALHETGKGALQNLKQYIVSDVVLFFSDMDAFALSAWLMDNQSPAKAKAGDIAPEDIRVEAGGTELLPGPAISELSSVGLKVAVEEGKIYIKQGGVIAKKGQAISNNAANVMAKLGIMPMKVGFIPVAAYDAVSEKIYFDIKIDKQKTLEELRGMVGKAFGFSINIKYVCKETIKWFISKAGLEEKALDKVISSKQVEGEKKGESNDTNTKEESK